MTDSTDGVGPLRWVDVPVTGTIVLPPDPRVMKAIGLNHALETAVADLVDNSIDAHAQTVLVRFVRHGDALSGLLVIDDGDGMDESTLDRAMTIGGDRDYGSESLGHFGMGLKAASLGQAEALTVITRQHDTPLGRRWTIQGASHGFECEIVGADFARSVMDTDWRLIDTQSGTVVRWDGVKAFPSGSSPALTERYLEQTCTVLRHHLGLVFHRLIEANRIKILVDVFDLDAQAAGPPFTIEAVDPFGYQRSGHPDYPKTLNLNVDGSQLQLACHVWSGRSKAVAFRLHGKDPERLQGFYFYRNDRLLQLGGWNGISTIERDTQLARVVIDLTDPGPTGFVMNPEKTRIETSHAFAAAIEQARYTDGSCWGAYLSDATRAYKDSQKRQRKRDPVVPPGRGFAPDVRRAVDRELDKRQGDPIEIRWDDLKGESFFEIDLAARSIQLNKKFRWAVLGDEPSSINDAPVVKTLLYLLIEKVFVGTHLGPREKDNLELWSSILAAAAKAQVR